MESWAGAPEGACASGSWNWREWEPGGKLGAGGWEVRQDKSVGDRAVPWGEDQPEAAVTCSPIPLPGQSAIPAKC